MRLTAISALLAITSLSLAVPPDAPAAMKEPTSLPSQDLDSALQSFVRQRHLQLIYRSNIVKGIKDPTHAIEGNFSTAEVLQQLLGGTGLVFQFLDEKTVMVTRASADAHKRTTSLQSFPAGSVSLADAPDIDADGVSNSAAPGGRLRLSQAGTGEADAASQGASRARPGESATLEEVVVTAQKRTQNILDVPLSVTALNADALQRAGIDTIQSLTYSVPSLVVQETGGGFQRYFIRGIGNGNSSTSLVGIYLDEADITTNGNSQLNLRAVDLERVEVLKGPQGTLYGAGSAGGTIRFITRDPNLQSFGGSADLQLYSTRYGAPSEEISGVLNMPLVTDELGMRIVGTYGNLGGWINQDAAQRTNINNQDLRDVRWKTLWKPNDDFWLKALVDVQRNGGHGTNASADSNYNLTLAVDPTIATPFTSDHDVYNVTANYTAGAVNLISSTTYLDTYTRAIVGLKYSVAPSPAPLFEFLNDPDTRVTHSFSQEFRLSSVATEPFHWIVGAFYKDLTINYTTDFQLGSGGDVLGAGTSVDNETSKSVSLFADGGYNLTPEWEIGGGLRYFHDDRSAFDGATTLSGSFHNLAPRLYTSYALSKDLHVYASAADGFRSGGFNAGDGIPNSTYTPEKIRSYELGIKTDLLQHSLSVQAALFFSRYQDMQYFVPTPNGIGMLSNAGNSHVWGADWSLDWQATRHLLLSLNGNITRSRVVSLLPDVTTVQVGDPVDYATDYSARVAATYGWNLTETLAAFAHLEFARVGPSHATDRGEGGDPILFTTDTINMLDARVGVSRGGWSLELFGDNLANADGVQDGAGAFGFGSRPRPRTIGIEARAEFQ